MSEESTHGGLRQGIDAAGEELGAQIASDLPSTPAEVRSQLPDAPTELVAERADPSAPGVRQALAESPLEEYFDADELDADCTER